MNIALIPARKGSKRIPRKNVGFMFCGKPLVAWTVDQANKATLIDKVVVSTDDRDFIYLGLDCQILDRPEEYARDDSTLEDVISHAIEALNLDDNDIVVCLQLTSPLRKPEDIDESIKAIRIERGCISVCKEDDLFLWNELIGAVTFDKYTRNKNYGSFCRENGSIYAFLVKDFKSTNSRYGESFSVLNQEKWKGFEIDTPEDAELCEILFKHYILGEKDVHSMVNS